MPKKKESRTEAQRRSSGVAKGTGWSALELDQQNRKRLIELVLIAMKQQRKRIEDDST